MSEEDEVEGDAESASESNTTGSDVEVYQKFLRGEDISDDDEDAMEGSLTLSDDEMSDQTDEEKYLQERDAEVVDLFTDLLRNPDVQDSQSGEMALAHLLHGSAVASRPLTRQLWNTLTQRGHSAPSSRDQPEATEMTERYLRKVEERDTQKGLEHICVICMLESREIICWPCRCVLVQRCLIGCVIDSLYSDIGVWRCVMAAARHWRRERRLRSIVVLVVVKCMCGL
jgi:hypothetical protein